MLRANEPRLHYCLGNFEARCLSLAVSLLLIVLTISCGGGPTSNAPVAPNPEPETPQATPTEESTESSQAPPESECEQRAENTTQAKEQLAVDACACEDPECKNDIAIRMAKLYGLLSTMQPEAEMEELGCAELPVYSEEQKQRVETARAKADECAKSQAAP